VARWLLKTEPGTYSWDDLVREQTTPWTGVSNPVALRNIRSMKRGDEVIVYHTGDEKAAVGKGTVASDPYVDPKAGDDRLFVVDVKAGQKLARPVTLAEIKADPAFKDFDLVRISRLSVMPVPDALWDRIQKMAASEPSAGPKPKTTPKKEARRR
jgi:predicted RNA-binding protein with PUA-like domain